MRISILMILMGTTGCVPTPAADPADTETADTEDTSVDPDVETAEPTPKGDVRGLVLGTDGSPVSNVRLTLCHFACRFMDPDPLTGEFLYDDVAVDRYALHVEELGSDHGFATVLTMFDVIADEQLVLDRPFTIEVADAGSLVTGVSDVAMGSGLTLTVDADALQLPFGVTEPILGGIRASALPPQTPVDEPLAVWLLEPFDAKSTTPMPFRIANEWDLAPGTTLHLQAASYADYDWIDAGAVTVSEDGTELVGGALTVFSTLVLEPPPF